MIISSVRLVSTLSDTGFCFFLPPGTQVMEGNAFRGVCQSFRGKGWSVDAGVECQSDPP